MIGALDSYNNHCITENGNPAYNWVNCSNYYSGIEEEMIVQFYFQAILDKNMDYTNMKHKFKELLESCIMTKYNDYCIRLLLQTRDIEEGKGLYELTYHMLSVLHYKVFHEKSFSFDTYFNILKHIVNDFKINEKKEKAYGSWKDIKYYLNILHHTQNDVGVRSIIQFIYIPQIHEDLENMNYNKSVTLLGKWLPREKSKKFGWIAKQIAKQLYFDTFNMRVSSNISLKYYRAICSKLNTYIDTTQVHMCNKEWDKINFNRVTGQTMLKSRSSFMNKRNIQEEHRIKCKYNLISFVENKINKNEVMKGKTIMPHYFVKESLKRILDDTEKNIFNLQWKGMIENITNKDTCLKYCIPCIDISPSMYNGNADPVCSAIGMGLATLEISTISRAFTFSDNPQWIIINKNDSPYDNIQKIYNSPWGGTTNIYKMFMMMLDACIENNITNEELCKYSLIIYSDMQFDNCCDDEKNLIDKVKKDFFEKGGYTTIPFLIFWNLRYGDNFPTINSTPDSLKLSGNSVSLLKIFLEEDIQTIKKMSNWSIIKNILKNDRYNYKK